MKNTGIPEIDIDKCTGCGDCAGWCPTGAVKVVNGKAVLDSPGDCCYCTDCEVVCPSGAIRCPFEIILVSAGMKAASPGRKRASRPKQNKA